MEQLASALAKHTRWAYSSSLISLILIVTAAVTIVDAVRQENAVIPSSIQALLAICMALCVVVVGTALMTANAFATMNRRLREQIQKDLASLPTERRSAP